MRKKDLFPAFLKRTSIHLPPRPFLWSRKWREKERERPLLERGNELSCLTRVSLAPGPLFSIPAKLTKELFQRDTGYASIKEQRTKLPSNRLTFTFASLEYIPIKKVSKFFLLSWGISLLLLCILVHIICQQLVFPFISLVHRCQLRFKEKREKEHPRPYSFIVAL